MSQGDEDSKENGIKSDKRKYRKYICLIFFVCIYIFLNIWWNISKDIFIVS